MLVGYDGHIIYRVYLLDEKKVICIKDLKIVENTNRKVDSQLTSYNIITASQDDIISNIPILSPHAQYFSPSFPATQPRSSSYTQTKSGQISKPPKYYDKDINNDM